MTASRLCAVALAAVLLPAVVGCGTDASRPAAVSCDDIAFTANSDDLAADIRATGIDCARARTFIRDADGAPGASFRGYTCTSRRVEGDALIHTTWRCTEDDTTIAWSRF
jgi:hypothetical protein